MLASNLQPQVCFAKSLSFSVEILKPTEYNPQSPVGTVVVKAQEHFLSSAMELNLKEGGMLWSSREILQQELEVRDQWQKHAEEWLANGDSTAFLQFVVLDSQLAQRYFEKKKIALFSANPTASGMEPLSELEVLLNQTTSDEPTGRICVLFDQHLIQADT